LNAKIEKELDNQWINNVIAEAEKELELIESSNKLQQ
jgi:hypothetical protein